MSGPAFTPGPWGISPETNGTELVAYEVKPWRVRDIIVRGNFSVSPNWKANARLIAAAPDMYEALERIIRCVDANGDGCFDTANMVVGVDRNGRLVFKGSFIAECIKAAEALAKAQGETPNA